MDYVRIPKLKSYILWERRNKNYLQSVNKKIEM